MYMPHIETNGKYFFNFAEILEQGAADQMSKVLSQDWVLCGALMPDAHQGYTLPIGGVIKTFEVVSPSFVGVDIGCGMCSQLTSFTKEDVYNHRYEIMRLISESIPLGKNHHKKPQTWRNYANFPKTNWFDKMFWEKGGLNQIGTLGGGNHFIEIGYDEQERVWITIHSGSRNVGHTTAQHYIAMAHPEGKVKDGAYGFNVNSPEGKDYIQDMQVCLAFALHSRESMIMAVLASMKMFAKGGAVDFFINRTHNHAESKDGVQWIHRKGATHAEEGMYGVIPGNMRDGSFIVRGKGNPDSLCSSSHGAGRILSRSKASEAFTADQVKAEMGDIAINFSKSMVDEAPGAYKNIFEVMHLQAGLVDVVHHIKPIICVKG